ncbi:hypothetical protein BDV37DRAFT_250623 [Aspergillus pseudonomiae]|uniref:Uncharacterized protein n=1 Tax=Aspergillus pseudonomiae TaxID=1506151 RepID=A0A5N7DAJ6_9EURO|nr:uncharacterized protein BDV37DRAFT_250623 [Aspergillus pseudonomiae]KAE8403259.1 hypothetical protein BDV37DRAFT_250623 [Aspergillus pseudonomiae]
MISATSRLTSFGRGTVGSKLLCNTIVAEQRGRTYSPCSAYFTPCSRTLRIY